MFSRVDISTCRRSAVVWRALIRHLGWDSTVGHHPPTELFHVNEQSVTCPGVGCEYDHALEPGVVDGLSDRSGHCFGYRVPDDCPAAPVGCAAVDLFCGVLPAEVDDQLAQVL